MPKPALNLIVKPHRPGRRLALVLGLSLLVYGAFEAGRIRAGYNLVDSREQMEGRDREIAQLKRQISGLRDQVVLEKTSRGIDSEAYGQIEQRLQVLQSTIQEQAEDLAFYKSIITPEDGQAGLALRNLSVVPGGLSGQFLVKIVLIQAKDHGRRVSGVVDFTVDGRSGGEAASLGLQQIRQGDEEGLAFSFRYFQELEQAVAFPEGFVPEKVHIEVRPKGRSARTLRHSIDWPAPPQAAPADQT